MKIYFIGFMGCGKSSLGKKVARKLGLDFIDLDKYIEQKEGRSINEIFAEKGEKYFREKEKEFLQETFSMKNVLISTGGGTSCFFDNMQEMNKNGTTVYLKFHAGILCSRLKNAKKERPLIKEKTEEELLTYISTLLEQREAFYNQANIIYEEKNMNPQKLADLIISF